MDNPHDQPGDAEKAPLRFTPARPVHDAAPDRHADASEEDRQDDLGDPMPDSPSPSGQMDNPDDQPGKESPSTMKSPISHGAAPNRLRLYHLEWRASFDHRMTLAKFQSSCRSATKFDRDQTLGFGPKGRLVRL